MNSLEIIITPEKDYDIIQLAGRLDSYSTPSLKNLLTNRFEDGQVNFLINLENLNYISSAGLLSFLSFQKKCKKNNGELIVCSIQKQIFDVFELAGFHSLFKIFPDLRSGINYFQKTEFITKIFDASFENLEKISDFVVNQSRLANFNSNEIYAIQTAVDEACSNIIDHAYGGEKLGYIKISIEQLENGIGISIFDDGKPFNPNEIPIPDVISPLQDRKERGLGVFFMRKLMDEVQYDFSNPDYNRLVMKKFKAS